MSADIQGILDSARDRHGVAGVSVALYENGQLTTACAGVCNVATGVAINADTVMHIGSITKVLNATLVMQLVDEGLIELEGRLLDYLPDVRLADEEALKQITIGMLLNHTSGIDGEIVTDHGPDQERIVDAILRFAGLGQIHEPGKGASYCNAATVLAGYLCQVLKNRSWYTLLEEQIFRPLDMNHAVVQPAYALLHRASVGHYRDPTTGSPIRTSTPFLPQSFAPAGGTAMLSASDLVTFARMHINDGVGPNGRRVLSANSALRMRQVTARFAGPGGGAVGLGWMTNGMGLFQHGGGAPGVVSQLFVHPDTDFALAILTNSAEGGALIAELSRPLLRELDLQPGAAAAADNTPAQASAEIPAYVGTYESVFMRFAAETGSDGLILKATPKLAPYETVKLETETAPLESVGGGSFKIGAGTTMTGAIATFVNPDAAGRMQHIAIGSRLYKRTG